jgi:hypothetical protein
MPLVGESVYWMGRASSGSKADALRGLAAALSDLLGLQSPHEAPREDSSDDIAWAFSDIAETLRHLERAFDETPCYRMLAISVRKAAGAVDELEEAWTQATAPHRLVAYGLDASDEVRRRRYEGSSPRMRFRESLTQLEAKAPRAGRSTSDRTG